MIGDRRLPLAAIFAGTAILPVAALAWLLHAESISHRDIASRVLANIATLAAEDGGRRLSIALDVGLIAPLTLATIDAERAGRSLPSIDESVPSQKLLAMTARCLFRLDCSTKRFTVASGTAPPWLQEVVAEGAKREAEPFYGFRLLVHDHARERYAVGCLLGVDNNTEDRRVVGFLADWSSFELLFRNALERGTSVAATIAPTTPDWIRFRISQDNATLFESATPRTREVDHQARLDARYGNLLIEAALDADATTAILSAGVPRSRWPEILALCAAVLATLGASAYAMHREHAVARLQEDFVASVSHELRSPLGQIRLFTETLLLDRVRSDEERRRSLKIMDQEARRLSTLVENILQFCRAERRAFTVHPRPIDLEAIVREAAAAAAPGGRDPTPKIEVVWASDWRAMADPVAARIVISNLLDNALKYGPPRQTVTVTGSQTEGVARITIDDQGPGIAAEYRDQVWRKFWRTPTDETAQTGAGIGLAVVREIVELHRGAIRIGDSPSGGARFVLELPTPTS